MKSLLFERNASAAFMEKRIFTSFFCEPNARVQGAMTGRGGIRGNKCVATMRHVAT